jgi:phytanoyl-CoA hydroxylase
MNMAVTLSASDRATFHADGALTLRGFVTQAELAEIRTIFNHLLEGKYPIPGNDIGEHTPGLLNCTAFSLYHPIDSLGILADIDRRALHVTEQLYASKGEFARDYEQLLRKLPDRPKSKFPPHWDQQYWPKSGSDAFDLRTSTFSLAVNRADEENGCLWYLPGSHKLRGKYGGVVSTLDGSRPLGGGVIDLEILPEDLVRRRALVLDAGDATFHEEFVIHGSEANLAKDRSRDTLIFAYRTKGMIEFERSLGFRHSYNDSEAILKRVRYEVF